MIVSSPLQFFLRDQITVNKFCLTSDQSDLRHTSDIAPISADIISRNLISQWRSATLISYNSSHCYEINVYFGDILKAIAIQSIFRSPLSTIIYNFTWISKPKHHAVLYYPIYPCLLHNQVIIRFSINHLKGWYSASYSSTFAGTSCVCKDDDGRRVPLLTAKCCHLQWASSKDIEFNGSKASPQFSVTGSND